MNLARLEQEFSALDALPDALYDVVVTHTHGALLTRTRGILQWREELLAGQLPDMDELCWPEKELCKVILMRIETLELADFCKSQESLTDSVLKDICEGISSAEDYLAKTGDKFRDKLAQQQKIKDTDSSFRDEGGLADHVQSRTPTASAERPAPPALTQQDGSKGSSKERAQGKSSQQKQSSAHTQHSHSHHSNRQPASTVQPSETKKGLSQQTQSNDIKPGAEKGEQNHEQIDSGQEIVDQLQQRWQDLANNWQQLNTLDSTIDKTKNPDQLRLAIPQNSENKNLTSRGWDLSTGLLNSQGWRDIIRYRRRIKELPELIRFIDAIGREKKISGDDSLATIDKSPVAAAQINAQGKDNSAHKIPRKVLEMDGIERGDDINRLLPSELALLCHPLLKTLWHARRAERLLLLYQHQGKRDKKQKTQGEMAKTNALNERGKKGKASLGRGPIIICLDTSGSMHGEPEHIAKAAVLEALNIAHREQRPCHLFAFSGPQQSTFHQLDLRHSGLVELLKFLQFSFHGGTDLSHILKLALAKQMEQGWGNADLLLVSDGRFPIDQNLLTEIENYKKTRKLRVFGILTGNWQHEGMQAFCNDLMRIRG